VPLLRLPGILPLFRGCPLAGRRGAGRLRRVDSPVIGTRRFGARAHSCRTEVPVGLIRSLVKALDTRVEKVFAPLRGNPIADRIFYTATALGDFGLLWLVLGLLRILRGRPGDTRAGLRAIIATGIESVLVNVGVKSLFKRRRPRPMEAHPLPFRQPITSSFPSGHATAAFCAATLLAEGEERVPVFYALATVVALSRSTPRSITHPTSSEASPSV